MDHEALIAQLVEEFPDGWALSTSAASLPAVLALCPPGVAVAAWMRGERPTRSYRPLAAWEPVIYFGGRLYMSPLQERRLDALSYRQGSRLTDPNRVIGAKPAAFCYWMFDLLGALPGDEFVDLFAGSGGVARAWSVIEAQAVAGSSSDASRGGDDRLIDPSLEYSATDGPSALAI